MRKLLHIWIFVMTPVLLLAQHHVAVRGIVLDEVGRPLAGSHVHLKGQCSVTDRNGEFSFDRAETGNQLFCISHVGFGHVDTLLQVPFTQPATIALQPITLEVGEVSVIGRPHSPNGTRSMETSTANDLTGSQAGSLAKNLEQLPGLNAMEIGTNISKPVIRGFGFHRVVVTENGIKQEGQQWGADHGLEIDPFWADQVVLIKGASSLEHGSGALGGSLAVTSSALPAEGKSASAQYTGRTVDQSSSLSAGYNFRGKRIFVKLKGTAKASGDYRLPVDTIVYLTRPIPIEDRKLKNSAGREYSGLLQLGHQGTSLQQTITLSNLYQKSGFFPGAHGIPDIERVKDDGYRFNIELPYQEVNHLKVVSNTIWAINAGVFHLDLGWQMNRRNEWSKFHTHYPGEKAPEQDPDLELAFRMNTFTANGRYVANIDRGHSITVGIQSQYQNNMIDGYNYLLPEYQSNNIGMYTHYRWQPSVKLMISGGARYDRNSIRSSAFFDQLLYDYLKTMLFSEEERESHAQRSLGVDKRFSDFSGMAGFRYMISPLATIGANIGRSFRNPTAIELGSNGIHHGSFRHEQGDPALDSETGFYFDSELRISGEKTMIAIAPYAYWFSNYIFLSPTGRWSVLPHAGQVYRYLQAPVWMAGAEISFEHRFNPKWLIEANIEAIANQQINRDHRLRYPLPFTPPPNLFAKIEYQPKMLRSVFKETKWSVQTKAVLAQNRVARNELPTNGYILLNAGFFGAVAKGRVKADVWLTVNNLLNKKHFNHISFYRKIGLPEPGRDIRLTVRIPIIK